jgi:ionotropic glutamate receptor
MNSNPNVFVRSTEEGVERVKNGSYAYLVESITNEYMCRRDCELIQIGGVLDTKGYGIGTPTGSPWREQISNAILRLQENGELQELYTKWWEQQEHAIKCDNSEDKKKDSASELSLASVGGVFAVLAGGLILSFLVALCEVIWMSRLKSVIIIFIYFIYLSLLILFINYITDTIW